MDTNLAESKLAYHGLETKSTGTDGISENSGKAEAGQVKSLIRTFLEDIGFDRSIRVVKDDEMKDAVLRYFKSLDGGEEIEKSIQNTLHASLNYAYHGYTSLPFQVRVLVAIQFVYMFIVDDVAEEFIEDLQAFGQRFILNQSHNHPILAALDSHLRNLSDYYGPYCHSEITRGMLDYINGRVIEYKIDQTNFKFSSDSRLMPMALRTKVGGAEFMVHLLFPNSLFPEEEYVMRYFPITLELALTINFTNDILSYYKEFCLADERGNFVANFADTHNVQHLDVLQYLTSYTPGLTKSAYKQLQNSPSLLAVVKNFIQGMILLFTAHRRYRLVELFEDEQYLLPYDADA
ncbi:Trichodiene synthase [Penicillium chrysogenum]|uniref:Pc21g14700 protein n=2 Tax=Penicillium chrysogenum species complex TaxID=254878 RepID=B6HIK6_PENRW|nr:Trichodiene synthase [Penicillium chrysogenum]CAP96367.1 Pc21g14700 [Penicillium rubens Wisconsin 54-1255]